MQNKKKLFIAAIIVLLMTMLFVITASANAIGDVDGDNSVTASDARLALRASVKLENFAPGSAKFLACDVDYDNTITASDARLILRASVKLEELKEKPSNPSPDKTHTHKWSAWTTERNAKNVVTGYHTRTCSAANCPVGTERAACSYGANIYTTSNKTPTCTAKVQYYNECSACKGKKVSQIDPLNHKNAKRDASKSLSPTCTEGGYDVLYCPDCKLYGKVDGTKEEKKLYVVLDALGHTVKPGDISGDKDVVCSRCNKTLTPSFNSLVNGLKTSEVKFSTLTRNDSIGTLKKFNLDVPLSVQLLMLAAGESIDDIKEQFTSELAQNDTTYSDYYYTAKKVADSAIFPVPGEDYVSALTGNDLKDINVVENLTEVDFIADIPDEAMIQLSSGSQYKVTLALFRGLVTADKNITKITVTTKDEKYSSIKNSQNETALMRITGLDIRTLFDSFNEKEDDDGFTLNMTCKDITSNCAVSYYFVVSEEEAEDGTLDTVYTPIAAKYLTTLTVDQHVDLALSVEGLGELMKGDIDLVINNITTNYYIFS